MSDCVLDWMKKHLPPEQWTRKTYLTLAYLGNPPEEPLDPELEAEIPEGFQLPENQSGWVGILPTKRSSILASGNRGKESRANTKL
jgi:hypothetical protein